MKPHPCGLVAALVELACRKGDANWLLHTLKNARRHIRLMSFWRAVNDPDFGTSAAQIVAHFLEARTVEEAGDADEADDAFLVFVGIAGGCVIARSENFPGRSPPEVDIKILEVLDVRADAPFRRRSPTVER